MISNSPATQRISNFGGPGVAQLREVIDRLISVVLEENRLLDFHSGQSLEQIIQKKGYLLLELMRTQRYVRPDLVRSELQIDILKLRNAMAENKRKLAIHFAAAKDITDSVLEVLRHNESDGTYLGWRVIGQAHR